MKWAEAHKTAVGVFLALGMYVLLCVPGVLALDPSLDISQYDHTTWTYRNGLQQGAIYAITQTPDGYLWLGTPSGVVRFDGVRAVPLPLPRGQQFPNTPVAALLTAKDGTLWIGALEGLASWKNGQLRQYPALARRTILALVQGRDGIVWAGGFGGPTATLCAIRDGSTTCYGDDGSLGAAVTSLYEDSDGTLWVGAATGLWRWRPGPPTRYLKTPFTRSGKMAQGEREAGLIVAVDDLRQVVGRTVTPYGLTGVPSPLTGTTVFRDRNGGLWIGTAAHGLVHSYAGKTSMFTHNDGLASDQVFAVFEGHEGSIWVATSGGLDQFRDLAVTSLSLKEGLSSTMVKSVLATRDGSVWIGTTDGLNRWDHGHNTIYRRRNNPGLLDDDIHSLFEDARGRIWVSTFSGLAAFENGRFTALPSVPKGTKNAAEGDNHGGLWLSLFGGANDYGLTHLVDGKIVEHVSWQKIGGGPGTGLVPDPDGGVWTGLLSGGLAYFRAGQVRHLLLSDDPGRAPKVLEISRNRDGSMWAATANGVSRIKDGRVQTLTTANGLPCNTVHWIIEDDLSSYWLYTECGLLRVPRADIGAWTADPKRTVRVTTFDEDDGVRLVAILKGFRPSVAKSSDGKIWFVNGDAVSFFDPSRISINTLPPPVHIEQITADNKSYDVVNGLRLPPGVRDLNFDFTALSLLAPEKVRFRVMLEGQDTHWRELVKQRHVHYSNLGPRTYRFRVIASNNSGVWNEQGDVLNFSIVPAYYQTNWFRALCAAAFLASLWAAYQFRVRQLTHKFDLTLEARVAERTRIARELHDTLLQSFQGLLPRLQAAIYKLPESPVDARKTLEATVERASQAITEGRDALHGLRMSTVEKNDLALAIQTLGEELASTETNEHLTAIRVVVEGTSRNLHPILRDEVYRIAAEALRNAFRHAAARDVEVEIRYDEKYFRLRVRDDGKGIRPELLRGHGREGHYGLNGMRERAKLVSGKLTIWSEVDSGTEIELIIPASRAYLKSTRRLWYSWKRSPADADVKETIERE